MKMISKIKKTVYILLATLFWVGIISSCSRNLMPPEGMIGEQTVGETASSKWVANEVPKILENHPSLKLNHL